MLHWSRNVNLPLTVAEVLTLRNSLGEGVGGQERREALLHPTFDATHLAEGPGGPKCVCMSVCVKTDRQLDMYSLSRALKVFISALATLDL